MCGIIKATGCAIPPVFVFPRVKYQDHFLTGAPSGSLGLSTKSGWMVAELFPAVLKHIRQHTQCSKDNPILLLIDNYSSHISIEAVQYAKDNGCILLSFPPHWSHRLQPLDVAVYGPFKGATKIVFNDWLKSNPGKQISIYNIPALAAAAFIRSFTPKNILSGFAKPGIYPLNRLAFTEEDFLCNYVHDRPITDISHQPTSNEESQNDIVQPSTSGLTCTNRTNSITPESVRPFPKAIEQTTGGKRKRNCGQSRIYTDTSEKSRLEEIATNRGKTNRMKCSNKRTKRSLNFLNIDCSRAEDEAIEMLSDDEMQEDIGQPKPTLLCDSDSISDYVLIKFDGKRSTIFYVGVVMKNYGDYDFEVKYMRKRGNQFFFPITDDISIVDREDIYSKLPLPLVSKCTKRQNSYMSFCIDLSSFNVC